jgi:hypothetical protein
MKDTGILEEYKRWRAKEFFKDGIHYEKYLVEKNFEWLKCLISDDGLLCHGILKPRGCRNTYKILIKYSPFLEFRPDRVYIADPEIEYSDKIHMYPHDKSLCLYYPKDIAPNRILHLADIMPWLSEWPVKYEFWLKYKVWLGDEVKH